MTDGRALCWGWNFFGQLGNGSYQSYGKDYVVAS
jgi:hypothetical protein